ncbi:MmyB family transcriptional regulator [Streptomyces nigrescens]
MKSGEEALRDDGNELGRLLQFWRSRLDRRRIPGVDTRRRRLKPGLTQEEFAKLAGVSLNWYRMLEGGEKHKFSESMLQRVATAAQLEEPERIMLFKLAVGHAPPTLRLTTDSSVDANMRALMDLMLPNPAYIIALDGTIVAHNRACESWFPWVLHEPNGLRWAFLHPEAREQLVNWREEWAGPFLAELRFSITQNQGSDELRKLRDDILEGCEEAQEIWDENQSQVHPDGDVRRFRLPYHGGEEVAVSLMALTPLRNTDLRFIVLLRAPDHDTPAS